MRHIINAERKQKSNRKNGIIWLRKGGKIMKWKKIVAVMLSAAMVTGLAACGSSGGEGGSDGSTGKIQISFLNGFTGGDGDFMKRITDGFNSSQDKYEIVESQEKDHLTQFKANGADLLIMGDTDLYTYAVDGMIQDLSGIYEKAELAEEDFVEPAIEAATIDGALYGVPLDIHPLTMFYNKELVSEEEVPETYEDLVALNDKLQAQDPSLYVMGIPGSGISEQYWMALAAQYGIELESDGYCDFSQDKLADVFMKWHDMVFVDHLSPANLGLDSEFTSFAKTADDITTQAAVALTGVWFYSTAADVYGENLGIAPIPTIGEEVGTYGSSHNFAVSSEVTDEEKIDGIVEFLKYAYTPENLLNWADSGQTPVYKPTMDLIRENPDQYPVPAVNVDTVETCVFSPQVYNGLAQTNYVTENIWGKVTTEEDLTHDELMGLLEQATKNAKQLAGE